MRESVIHSSLCAIHRTGAQTLECAYCVMCAGANLLWRSRHWNARCWELLWVRDMVRRYVTT